MAFSIAPVLKKYKRSNDDALSLDHSRPSPKTAAFSEAKTVTALSGV